MKKIDKLFLSAQNGKIWYSMFFLQGKAMAFSQQKFREIVFQLLFSQDFVQIEEEILDFMMHQLAVTKSTMRKALEKGKLVASHFSEIDEVIRRFSSAYDIDRIGKVERTILRLGIYELCYESEIPSKVAIAEAIRLARKFSTAESSLFVNAVLDAYFQSGEKDVRPSTIST